VSVVRATITVVTATATVTLDPLARNPVAVDVGRAADVLVRVVQYRRAPLHTASALDAAALGLEKQLAHTVGATDDLGGVLSLDDDQTIGLTKALSPVASVSEAIDGLDAGKGLSHGLALSDGSLRQAGKLAADTAQAQDTLSRVASFGRELPAIYALDYFAEDYTATDKALASEQFSASLSRPVSHGAGVAELPSLGFSKGPTHTARLADAASFVSGKAVGVAYADGYFAQDYTDNAEAIFVGDLLGGRVMTKGRSHTSRALDTGTLAMPTTYASDYFAGDYAGLLRTW
jgi:hypothetical protein